jgi:hypothetical protein
LELVRRPKRLFEGPVAWLFGRQLIGSIKSILLYAAYGKKLDPRDWMDAGVFPDRDRRTALQFWRERAATPPRQEVGADAERFWDERGEFWFDYIADTGDGSAATYSVAYLCAGDLYVNSREEDALRSEPFVWTGATKPKEGSQVTLPRGEFLLVGGDTSYHVSDYITLANRFQLPFTWAYEDLVEDLGDAATGLPNRPLFGIPGNHDYYDQLDGFRRQFRRAVDAEPGLGPPPPPDPTRLTPQLCIPGYVRCQIASYVALQLPFEWWLWGLDTEVGQIDKRQQRFFRQLCASGGTDGQVSPPKKLIVATCAPTTVFGKYASVNDEKAYDAIVQLGLPTPFRPRKEENGSVTEAGDAQLKAGGCRLDLSGDVHQYARYWGPCRPGGQARLRAKQQAPSAESYASIVSGLGGAFHHSTRTYLDEVQEQTLYPNEVDSTSAIASRLLAVRHIARGGFIWLAGAVIAFVITFAANVPQSSREIINNFIWVKRLGLVDMATPVRPTTFTVPQGASSTQSIGGVIRAVNTEPVSPAYTALVWRTTRWIAPDVSTLNCSAADKEISQRLTAPVYFYWPCRVPWPSDYLIGLLLFLIAPAIPLALTFSKRVFKRTARGGSVGSDQKGPPVEAHGRAAERPAAADTEIDAEPAVAVWTGTALATLSIWTGLAWMKPYREHITPFGSSAVTFWTLLWMAAAVGLSVRYSEFLFKRSHRHNVASLDWVPVWALPIAGLFGGGFGLWSFGKNNLPALLTSDIVFIAVCLGTIVGLAALPFYAGGELLQTRSATERRFGTLAIGLWHAFLQLSIPFVLIRRGGWLTWVVAGVAMLGFGRLGGSLIKRDRPLALALLWTAYGVVMVTAPWWTTAGWWPLANTLRIGPDGLVETTAWGGLSRSLLAAIAGAIMSCSLFGWYLAVCFMFNGHNNEAGGAARIEEFKGFVRVCLRRDSLTVYAIAVDEPRQKGIHLQPKIVDVFTLRSKLGTGDPIHEPIATDHGG